MVSKFKNGNLSAGQKEACIIKCLKTAPATIRQLAGKCGLGEVTTEKLLVDSDFFLPPANRRSGPWEIAQKGIEFCEQNKIEIASESVAEDSGKSRVSVIEGAFIFDPSQVLRRGVFVLGKLNEEVFAFGMCLPKEVSLKAKGNIVGTDQIWSPVLIDSNHKLHEPTKKFELDHKIKFDQVPSEMELRWDLRSIKKYLDKKTKPKKAKDIFKKIRAQYEKFMFFRNPVWYDIHALWDMGTYLFELFNVYPLLELRGLSGTAKTKCMKVSRMITLNATNIMINPSEATLFRETHAKRPTKYIDEAEKLFQFNRRFGGMESDSRVELINGSYSKGSTVPRQEKIKDRFVTVYYQCYSPTQIGSIRGLYGATESRAITHVMTKASDKDPRGEIEVENYENDPVWEEIRSDLYMFVLQNWKKIETDYKNFKEDTNIKKRDLQLWKPLLTIAMYINDGLFASVVSFAENVSEQRKQDFIPEGTLDYDLLMSIKEILEEREGKVYIKDIADKYKELHPDHEIKPGFNKRISTRLDNMGFKELRERDRSASFFNFTRDLFESIILPICPNLAICSTSSTHSPHKTSLLNGFNKEKGGESVVNRGEGGECGANGDDVGHNRVRRKRGRKKKEPDVYDKLQAYRDSEIAQQPIHEDHVVKRFGFTEAEIDKACREGVLFRPKPGHVKIVQ